MFLEQTFNPNVELEVSKAPIVTPETPGLITSTNKLADDCKIPKETGFKLVSKKLVVPLKDTPSSVHVKELPIECTVGAKPPKLITLEPTPVFWSGINNQQQMLSNN